MIAAQCELCDMWYMALLRNTLTRWHTDASWYEMSSIGLINRPIASCIETFECRRFARRRRAWVRLSVHRLTVPRSVHLLWRLGVAAADAAVAVLTRNHHCTMMTMTMTMTSPSVQVLTLLLCLRRRRWRHHTVWRHRREKMAGWLSHVTRRLSRRLRRHRLAPVAVRRYLLRRFSFAVWHHHVDLHDLLTKEVKRECVLLLLRSGFKEPRWHNGAEPELETHNGNLIVGAARPHKPCVAWRSTAGYQWWKAW